MANSLTDALDKVKKKTKATVDTYMGAARELAGLPADVAQPYNKLNDTLAPDSPEAKRRRAAEAAAKKR